MPETEITLTAFAEEHGLTLEILEGPDYQEEPASGSDRPWPHHAYKLRINRAAGGSMDSPWRQGISITDDPDIESLLDSIASDSSTVDNSRGFDDWANELGYSPMESSADYNRAKSIYEACERQRDAIRELIGPEAYETLLYGTERL